MQCDVITTTNSCPVGPGPLGITTYKIQIVIALEELVQNIRGALDVQTLQLINEFLYQRANISNIDFS